MPLVATVGAPDANSYVTLDEANIYFATGVHLLAGAWNALPAENDDAAKKACLITATRQVDRLKFWGCKFNDTQALQFPREYCEWRRDQIPLEIKQATLEQAVSLAPNFASGGQSTRDRLQAQGVSSYSIGDLSETFAANRTSLAATGSAEAQLCQEARIILASGFIRRAGQVRAGRRLS